MAPAEARRARAMAECGKKGEASWSGRGAEFGADFPWGIARPSRVVGVRWDTYLRGPRTVSPWRFCALGFTPTAMSPRTMSAFSCTPKCSGVLAHVVYRAGHCARHDEGLSHGRVAAVRGISPHWALRPSRAYRAERSASRGGRGRVRERPRVDVPSAPSNAAITRRRLVGAAHGSVRPRRAGRRGCLARAWLTAATEEPTPPVAE